MRVVWESFLSAFTLVASTSAALGAPIPRDCAEMKTQQKTLAERAKDVRASRQKSDYESLNISALKLRVLAKAERCGMSLKDEGHQLRVRYRNPDSTVSEDVFSLGKTYEVLSWTRIEKSGVKKVTDFSGLAGENPEKSVQ